MAKKQGRKGGRPPRTDQPTKLTISIASALKLRLRLRAVTEGRTASAIIEQALGVYLRGKS